MDIKFAVESYSREVEAENQSDMDEEVHTIIPSDRYSKRRCGPFTLVLGVGFVVTLLLAMVLAIVLGVKVDQLNSVPQCAECNQTNTTDENLCLTPSCVKLAASLLTNMNQSIDPCEDFYNFTCGGWEANNLIPEDRAKFSSFAQLADRNTVGLKKVLDRGEDDGVEAVRKVLDLYQSCLNLTAIEEQGAAPLLDIIQSTGGWTLLTGSDSGWGINNASFLQEKLSNSPAFFAMDVAIDDKNSSRHLLELSQSGITLSSPAAYDDPNSVQAATDFITSVLSLLAPDGNKTLFQKAAMEVIEFEHSLAKIFYGNVELRDIDKTYNLLKLNELQTLWPDFQWEEFVTNLLLNNSVEIPANETVLVRTPDYFTNLTQLYNSTEHSVLENYAKWQLVSGYISYLSEDFRDAYYQFTKATAGTGEQDRYVICISIVQSLLPIALARPYSKFILPEGTKGNVSTIVDNIKTAFKERLDENSWLDSATRDKCKQKVDAISKQVAYPDQLFNDTYLNGLYATYPISPYQYFDNVFSSSVQISSTNLKQLRMPVDKTQWLNAPTAVNAYYDPQFNGFVFLEGILNVPFFEAGWPLYSKYGALGVVAGHELTHGFDDQGQRYNKDGILTPWWSNSSVEAFRERKQCFVDQYSQYELFGYKINGSLTLGENIADNGGIKSAFRAYQDQVIKSGVEAPLLPGLSKYTPEQLYFISFGQVWCSLFSPAAISVSTKVDPHSPGPFRVIGSLVNDGDFSKTFNCPVNSTMNPEKKCLLW